MSIVPTGVSRQVFRGALILKKNSPNIMFAAGVTGVVTSTVMACRATLKLADDLPKMKHDLEVVKETEEVKTVEEYRKDVATVYGVNAAKVIQLYGPAVVVGTVSIAALTGSHVVLNRRNAGLTAAYAAVSKAYDEYRDRVKKEVGDDRELDIYHAARVEKVDLPDSKGKKVNIVDPNRYSPYARFFDEQSTSWQKNAEYNRVFIDCQQNYTNDLLHARGHVFLNEVYDLLGLPRSKAGQVVGWVISEDGDNFIDFGLYEAGSEAFINGYEPRILLDFNVDGVIYDKIN